jgi:uncharacterized membrane protein
VIVLGALALIWIVTFAILVHLRQARIWSVDFDMGIHAQSVWLLAHLRGFSTVRGLQVFGHHATLGYLLYVPFAWLGAGADFLNITQVVIAGLGAVPVFLLARFRTGNAWIGAALGACFLLHPALQFFMAELFHPDVIAITPLLCAYYCAVRRHWVWFTCFAVLAVCWKEDVALAVVVLGLLIAVRGDRRVGLWTSALALAWFLAWTLMVFPLLDHGAIQSAGLYADVGRSPGGIVRTAFSHPGRLTSKLLTTESRDYAWKLFAPFGVVALAAPAALLLGLPQSVLNLLTNVAWTKTITFHYAALPLVAVTIASVEGVAWLVKRTRREWARAALVGFVLGCALVTTVAWGPSPLGAEYRNGVWPLKASPRVATARAALALVPGRASVSASYTLVPQLAERAEIYSFPNPWKSQNFGIDGWPRRDPGGVRWVVLDRATLDADSLALFDRLVATGRFETVFDRDGFVVSRRVR